MTAAVSTTGTYVGPVPLARLVAVPALIWPQNVPNRHDSVSLMFEPRRLPEALREPTLQLMNIFIEQKLAEGPPGVDFERWHLALATVFRLQAAAALAKTATRHDEASLQELFTEAAEARDWLLELTFDVLFESTREVMSLRGLLQVTWDEVLEAAPTGDADAPERPASRTGETGLRPHPKPPPEQEPVEAEKPREFTQVAYRLPPIAQPRKLRPILLSVALAAALGLVAVFGPRPAEVSSGGAPEGWVLSGSYRTGVATVFSATVTAPPRAALEAWFGMLEADGVTVTPHGTNEWLLSRQAVE